MRRTVLLGLLAGLVCSLAGCVSVKAPETVSVGGSSRPEPVDSSRVPATSSHEEARHELAKAYQNIQYLEKENAKLERKVVKYKRSRERCKDQLEECEDRLKKYEDD